MNKNRYIVLGAVIVILLIGLVMPFTVSDTKLAESYDITCAKNTSERGYKTFENLIILKFAVDEINGDNFKTSGYTLFGIKAAEAEGTCGENEFQKRTFFGK